MRMLRVDGVKPTTNYSNELDIDIVVWKEWYDLKSTMKGSYTRSVVPAPAIPQ